MMTECHRLLLLRANDGLLELLAAARAVQRLLQTANISAFNMWQWTENQGAGVLILC